MFDYVHFPLFNILICLFSCQFVILVCFKTAENYGDSDPSSDSSKTRKDYLKEARKKYYFHDASIPSFRLFEWEDDNGNYIKERELWRPLNTNSQGEYNYEKKESPEAHKIDEVKQTPSFKVLVYFFFAIFVFF
jgi:hypothetical protein